MRTLGTFQDIYQAAKNMKSENKPINPVIRRESELWMIESALEPTNGDFEVELEDFNAWFYETYKTNYIPNDADMNDFLNIFAEDK
jgi:hypothetical protein